MSRCEECGEPVEDGEPNVSRTDKHGISLGRWFIGIWRPVDKTHWRCLRESIEKGENQQ